MTSKTQSSAKASKPIEDAVAAGKETIEQAMKASTEGYEQAIAMGKEHVANTSNAMFRSYDDIATLNKQNVEAAMKAGNIWAKVYENFGKAYFSHAQDAAERGTEAAKAMMTAKTMQDVIDLQTDFAKQRFDHLVAEGTKMSEILVRVATEAMEPLQKQFDTTVSTLTKPIAL